MCIRDRSEINRAYKLWVNAILSYLISGIINGEKETWCGTYGEELFGGSSVESAVVNVRLFGQIIGWLDGRQHALHGEERRQVCRVRWDDYESEEPPSRADYSPRHRPIDVYSTQIAASRSLAIMHCENICALLPCLDSSSFLLYSLFFYSFSYFILYFFQPSDPFLYLFHFFFSLSLASPQIQLQSTAATETATESKDYCKLLRKKNIPYTCIIVQVTKSAKFKS